MEDFFGYNVSMSESEENNKCNASGMYGTFCRSSDEGKDGCTFLMYANLETETSKSLKSILDRNFMDENGEISDDYNVSGCLYSEEVVRQMQDRISNSTD